MRIHFHYALFAEILQDLARTVASLPVGDLVHRDALRGGAKALCLALEDGEHDSDGRADLTPEEEVRLLHIME